MRVLHSLARSIEQTTPRKSSSAYCIKRSGNIYRLAHNNRILIRNGNILWIQDERRRRGEHDNRERCERVFDAFAPASARGLVTRPTPCVRHVNEKYVDARVSAVDSQTGLEIYVSEGLYSTSLCGKCKQCSEAILQKPVVIFGAGATAACGGPTTDQILPSAFRGFYGPSRPRSFEREDFFGTVECFLIDAFQLPKAQDQRTSQHYPSLPLLLSLIDTAIDRNQPFAGQTVAKLRDVRAAVEYLIFAVLFESLQHTEERNPYRRMFDALSKLHFEPVVISLNYDVIADNALFALSLQPALETTETSAAQRSQHRLPDYGCDIRTAAYSERLHNFGLLLKLHGSLNWIYCPNCHRLDIGMVEVGPELIYTRKVLDDLYQEVNLHDKYSCQGAFCKDCQFPTRPVLITPTYRKDYRNPHIAQVWYDAERVLRNADRVFLVGYSLPSDDVEVIYLLKRGLQHLVGSPGAITVVLRGGTTGDIGSNEVGLRYRSIFGDTCDYQFSGFQEWVKQWESNPL